MDFKKGFNFILLFCVLLCVMPTFPSCLYSLNGKENSNIIFKGKYDPVKDLAMGIGNKIYQTNSKKQYKRIPYKMGLHLFSLRHTHTASIPIQKVT